MIHLQQQKQLVLQLPQLKVLRVGEHLQQNMFKLIQLIIHMFIHVKTMLTKHIQMNILKMIQLHHHQHQTMVEAANSIQPIRLKYHPNRSTLF